MFTPSLEDTRSELREETQRLLVRRSIAGLWLCLFSIVLFTLADRGNRPDLFVPLLGIKLLQAGTIAALLWRLGRPEARPRALWIALVAVTSVCITTAASGIVSGDRVTTPLLFIVLSMATATLLPWGVAPQLFTIAVAGLSILWNVWSLTGSVTAWLDYPVIAMVVAFVASLYIAYEFDRYRLAIEQRNLALRVYRDVVENANDAIVTLDSAERITGLNRGAELMFGYSGAELIGRPLEILFSSGEVEDLRSRWAGSLRGDPLGAIFSLEARRSDGQLVRLEVKARTLGGTGSRNGSQAIMRDVTAKKIAEQMRSDFVAMLSHDMKTPLAAILGFSQMLREQIPADPEMKYLVDRIEANAQLSLSLATNFVEVSRIESGSFQLRLEPTSLNEIVEQALRHQESVARSREISVEKALGGDLPRLRLDRRQIDRVVANLVSNAIKFSPPRSSIRIETGQRGGRVRLIVRDRGPGIAPQDRPHLFERYKRFSGQSAEGSGLGLFIVKTLVDAHGGRVSVDCPPEGGTAFEVSFDERALAA